MNFLDFLTNFLSKKPEDRPHSAQWERARVAARALEHLTHDELAARWDGLNREKEAMLAKFDPDAVRKALRTPESWEPEDERVVAIQNATSEWHRKNNPKYDAIYVETGRRSRESHKP